MRVVAAFCGSRNERADGLCNRAEDTNECTSKKERRGRVAETEISWERQVTIEI